ncbi:OTU domain-containing protein [Cotesia congregata filamentous virus 1]|uniref:ubiquitinyl hydrolase 1 n=1 Tax=Cotesia congregata filamentous virus 1 TaxID=3064291 RepID=A0ABC8QS14_9VIRU|nr:OTU domain-containing protein [Cotesia congregata filamentous virus 1]
MLLISTLAIFVVVFCILLDVTVAPSVYKQTNGSGDQQQDSNKIVPITGDGNCLFRALAYLILGNQNRYNEIKREVLKEIKKNSHFYMAFMTTEDNKTYFENFKQEGFWGGEIEIAASAAIYRNYTIYIHVDRIDDAKPKIYGSGPQKIKLLFKNAHYSAIV